MKFRFGRNLLHAFKVSPGRARDEDIVIMLIHRFDNAPDLLPRADGAIVGTYFHLDGIIENPVDPGRVDRFMSVVRRLRQT